MIFGWTISSFSKPIVSLETIRLMMSLQVDRVKQRRIQWNRDYENPSSEAYRTLEDEAIYAVSLLTHSTKL